MSTNDDSADAKRIEELAAYVARACEGVERSVRNRLSSAVTFRDLLDFARDPNSLGNEVDFDSAARARQAIEELRCMTAPDHVVNDVITPDSETTVFELSERVRFIEKRVNLFDGLADWVRRK